MTDTDSARTPTNPGPSQRRLSAGRRLYYFAGLPLLRLVLRLLWTSYRVRIIPEDALGTRPPVVDGSVCAPCYWHQHHVMCTYLIRRWIRNGLRVAFLVSDSVDGEVPARTAQAWGAQVIRGSSNRTGAAALRDMRQIAGDGISIVTTADGPLGPKYEFKAGVVLMANLTGSSLLPLACAANRAWYLRRWDDFMIPKPFARVVVGVGEPYRCKKSMQPDEIEAQRSEIQAATMDLLARCETEIGRP